MGGPQAAAISPSGAPDISHRRYQYVWQRTVSDKTSRQHQPVSDHQFMPERKTV